VGPQDPPPEIEVEVPESDGAAGDMAAVEARAVVIRGASRAVSAADSFGRGLANATGTG
jgi:hypothetical protein